MGLPYSAAARSQINWTVRQARSGAFSGRGPRVGEVGQGLSIWLARATTTFVAGDVGNFVIQRPQLVDSGRPDGTRTEKGYELDDRSNDGSGEAESFVSEVDAYVRDGCCFEDGIYILIEVCGADDAILEVLNPTIRIRGLLDGDVLKGFPGTVSVSRLSDGSYGDAGFNISAFNELQDRSASDIVYCEWEQDTGDEPSRWRIYAWEC